MNRSPATILAEHLTAASGALFADPTTQVDWSLYISSMPDADTPAKVACVYDTTPRKLGRLMTGRELWAHGIQIKLRAPDYQTGWEKGEALVALLETLHNESVTLDGAGYTIEYFSQTSRLLSLGQDEQRRHLFAVNGVCVITEQD